MERNTRVAAVERRGERGGGQTEATFVHPALREQPRFDQRDEGRAVVWFFDEQHARLPASGCQSQFCASSTWASSRSFAVVQSAVHSPDAIPNITSVRTFRARTSSASTAAPSAIPSIFGQEADVVVVDRAGEDAGPIDNRRPSHPGEWRKICS